jgi:hypothetical protein
MAWTDAFAVIDNGWYILSEGSAPWSLLRTAPTPDVDNLVVADLNNDGRSDRALSDSSTWKVFTAVPATALNNLFVALTSPF